MRDSIFREYDIRGKIGSEFIINEVYNLTRSIAFYFVQQNPEVKTVAVGMDGRHSSPEIKNYIIAALQDSGLDVIFIGLCPSPVLYFALHTLNVDAGLMITASHNPAEYNGIKISLGTTCIWGAQIKKIRDLYREKKYLMRSKKGSVTQQEMIPVYIQWMRAHFAHLIGMNLPIAIDCGNGAGGAVIPELVKAMEWTHVQLLCAEVDGSYPHHEADPVVEKNMQHIKDALARTHAQVGIGLDGDADRMAAMSKSGVLIPGDQLLAIFAQEVLKKFPGSAVVFDVKASQGLIELLQQWDAKPCISPCGHAIIKSQMDIHKAPIAGELSCHFFFADRYFGYDDGIYAMMRLLELVQGSGKSLDQLLEIFPKKWSSPEFRIACPEEMKEKVITHIKGELAQRKHFHVLTLDGVRFTTPFGWALVRPSNTQPVLSLRCEGNTQNDLNSIKKDVLELLSPFFDKTKLEHELDIG